MIKNYDKSSKIKHKSNWPYIPDHPCSILIIAGSGSGKTHVLLKIIKHQRSDIDLFYLYVKDPFQSMYQLLNNEKENVGIKVLKCPKAFIEYSQMTDVSENLNTIIRKRIGKC